MINIAGIPKFRLLQALYAASKPLGMGMLHFVPGGMDDEEAKNMCKGEQLYFDYVRGRVIKCNISGDVLDPRLYDRDNGQGACERAVLKAIEMSME